MPWCGTCGEDTPAGATECGACAKWWRDNPPPDLAGVYISQEQLGSCQRCGKITDLRLGHCFDCATDGERKAAQRTVAQHVGRSFYAAFYEWDLTSARIFLRWAWERFTRAGDYKPGGEFERQYGVKL